MAFNWTCPHCNRAQSVVPDRVKSSVTHIGINELAEGRIGIQHLAIGCANPECGKLTLSITIGEDELYSVTGASYFRLVEDGKTLFSQQILPRSSAKPQPDFIPQALREDYFEACLIRDESPKAAATLARRCLQGMIRDFGQVSGRTLYDEIFALRAAVDEGAAPRGVTIESVEAIDHVRGVGNIGAHMEKDINLIVPVDVGEAQALIELIEMLFEEWYVERHRRQRRLSAIRAISEDKKAQQGGGPQV